MARGIVQKYILGIKLNNGTTTTGAVKTVNVSLSPTSDAITITNYAGTDETSINEGRTKALAIATAIGACLTKSVYAVLETRTASIVS